MKNFNSKDSLKVFFPFLILVSGWFFYSKRFGKYQKSNIQVTHYTGVNEPLAQDILTQEEKVRISQLHHECFDDTRKEKLFNFFSSQQKNADDKTKDLMRQKILNIVEESRKELSSFLWKSQNLFLAKNPEGEIIGLFTCADDINYTHAGSMIYNVCVDPKHQGRGVGKMMMEEGIKKCKKPDRDLGLTVYKDHIRTIELYERLGFQMTPPPVRQDPGAFDFYDKYFMIWRPKP